MKKIIFLSLILSSYAFTNDEIKLFNQSSEESCFDAREKAKESIDDEELMKSALASRGIILEYYRGYKLGDCIEEKNYYLVPLTVLVNEEWLSNQARIVIITQFVGKDLKRLKEVAQEEVRSGATLARAKSKRNIGEERISYSTSFQSSFRDMAGYYTYATVVVLIK